MDDLEELQVYNYEIEYPYIIVTLSNFKKEKIEYSKENEKKLLKSMEKRIKEDNRKVNSKKERIFFEKLKKSVLNTSLFSILVSGVILSNFNEPGFSQERANVLLAITSVFHIFCSALYEVFNIAKIDCMKFELFFKNKKNINELVKKYPQLLDKIKSSSKKDIIKNIEENRNNPVNVNNIDSMNLKEVQELVQRAKFYKESDFEKTSSFRSDDINELVKKYDNVSEDTIKIQRLKEVVSLLKQVKELKESDNLDELSKKYDSIEVEKPKKKKGLIRRI